MKGSGSMWARLLPVLLVLSMLAACGDDDDDGAQLLPPPDLITFESLNLQPEGIEYDDLRGRFLVGSAAQGVIHTVDDQGNLTVLVADPGLSASNGLHIDRERDRLLVAGTHSATGRAGLGIYDLESGELVHLVDLTSFAADNAGLFANDVVVDSAGTAYVTDTTAGAIHIVDADGVARGLIFSSVLALANGIEIFDDEVLLVSTLGGPSLVRVPLRGGGGPFGFPELVDLGFETGGDGIVFTPAGDLAVVTIGGPSSVVLLRSDDAWQTATLTGGWDSGQITDSGATTAAVRGEDVYAVFPRLFDAENSRNDIERVVFEAVE